MGGKGGSSGSVPTAYPPPSTDYTELLGPIIMMMTEMTTTALTKMADLQEQYASPAMPDLPDYKEIDWAKKQEELYNQVKGQYAIEKARRFGTEDTILTSPLLDEDEAETTGSLIGN